MFWMNLLAFSLSLFGPPFDGACFYEVTQPVPYDAVYPCPPGACPAPSFAPMPMILPAPAEQLKSYRVEVRFVGGSKDVPPVKTMTIVREKMPASSSSLTWMADGATKCATLSSAVKPVSGDRVELELCLVNGSCHGKPCCMTKSKVVPLDTPTSVVLQGVGPEPCTAEVTVREVKELPPPSNVAMTAPCMPCPGTPVVRCGGTATADLPMPMPCPPGAVARCGGPAPTCCPPGVPCYQPTPMPAPVCCPLPEPIQMVTPYMYSAQPIQVCTAVNVATPSRTSHFCLVHEGKKACVKLTSSESCVTCKHMTDETGAAGKITVSAGKKHVHVKGKMWKATADSIDVREDGTVTMRGHVKLVSDKIGVGATVKAEELCVKVKHGAFDKIVEKGAKPHDEVYYTPAGHMTKPPARR